MLLSGWPSRSRDVNYLNAACHDCRIPPTSRFGPAYGRTTVDRDLPGVPVVGDGVHKFGDVDTASVAKVRASPGKLKVVVSRISPDDP